MVLLEDLHWADAASLDWLEQFAPRDISLLVVASSRPALLERRPHWGEGLDHHTAIRLSRLSNRETRLLVGEILAKVDAVPDWLETLLVDSSEGNPFFVEELVKWLLDTGVVVATADGWTVAATSVGDIEVPGTLRGVLQARLDSLEHEHRSVIDRAAVVGRVFWDEAVAELGAESEPDPEGAYDRLREHEVVFQRPTSTFEGSREYSFRHSLMRDVAYESVLRSARRRYHARAAIWLERVIAVSNRPDEHAATIAAHYRESGDAVSAARWYLRAGLHAAGTYANEDASRLLEAAIGLTDDAEAELRFDVLLARESVLDRRGEREEQRKALDEMASMEDVDPARRTRYLLAEGGWRFFHGEYAAVSELADEAAPLARGSGESEPRDAGACARGEGCGLPRRPRASRALATELVGMARAAGNHRMLGRGTAPGGGRHQPRGVPGGGRPARRGASFAAPDRRPRGRSVDRRPAGRLPTSRWVGTSRRPSRPPRRRWRCSRPPDTGSAKASSKGEPGRHRHRAGPARRGASPRRRQPGAHHRPGGRRGDGRCPVPPRRDPVPDR